MGRIVVGVDGSDPAINALRWAVREARAHDHILDAVTVSPPELLPEAAWVAPTPPADVLLAIKHVQAEALAQVDTDDLVVLEHREIGFPADLLLEHAEGADLLVVGTRGLGTFGSVMLGSVSRQLATHATCNVAVVPENAPPIRRVVVGVDGSQHARHALQWAWDEARAHDATLEVVAVHNWSPVGVGAPWFPLITVTEPHEGRERTQAMLDEIVDAVTHGAPRVVRTLLDGPPAPALLGRAEDADLLVVGSRGLGGFERLLLGSVSARCIVHSPCPVVVVREG